MADNKDIWLLDPVTGEYLTPLAHKDSEGEILEDKYLIKNSTDTTKIDSYLIKAEVKDHESSNDKDIKELWLYNSKDEDPTVPSVKFIGGDGGWASWGYIEGDISDQLDLTTYTEGAIQLKVNQKNRIFKQSEKPVDSESYTLLEGDLWYCTSDTLGPEYQLGHWYTYQKDTTEETYSWVETTDQQIVENAASIQINKNSIETEVNERQTGEANLSSKITQTASMIKSEVGISRFRWYEPKDTPPVLSDASLVQTGDLWYCSESGSYEVGKWYICEDITVPTWRLATDEEIEASKSSIEQNASSISAEVSRAKGEEDSISGLLDIEAGKISQIVTAVGKDGKVTSGSIVLAINENTEASTATINADRLNLQGVTTFTYKTAATSDEVDFADTLISKTNYYMKNSDPDDPTKGNPTEWSTSVPAWENGRYIWEKTLTKTAEDQSTGAEGTWSDPVNITGAKGAGPSIGSNSIAYALSDSGTVVPISGWSSTQPTPKEGKYLWTRTIVTYNDPNNPTGTYTTTSYSISYYGTSGGKGDPGVSCTSIINQYRIKSGSSYTEWSTTIPSFSELGETDVVQTRQQITWSNSTTTYTDPETDNILSGIVADFNGKVSFTALKNKQSQTIINGANIDTGTITATQISSGAITADKIKAGEIEAGKLKFTDGTSASSWSGALSKMTSSTSMADSIYTLESHDGVEYVTNNCYVGTGDSGNIYIRTYEGGSYTQSTRLSPSGVTYDGKTYRWDAIGSGSGTTYPYISNASVNNGVLTLTKQTSSSASTTITYQALFG